MKTMSSLKANVIYNILYQILVLIVPLVTAPYISRVIGANGLGVYGYTFSIAHYFVIFIMLGIINYGNREISVLKNDRKLRADAFWNIYINQFVMGCLFIAIYFVYALFYCNEYKDVFLIQSFYIISGVLDISWFYFGIEKYKLTTGISSINKIITTICIFLFVKGPSDITIYTLIISIATLLNNLAYWILLPTYVGKSQITFIKAKKHLKTILILFLPVIAINIYRYISKVMLGSMSDISEVGVYDAAEKFVNLPLGVIAAVGTVMLSRISNLTAIHDEISIKKYNHLSMIAVMFVGIGVTFGLAGIATDFIPWFYGEEFIPSSIILIILLPTILTISWSNVIRNQYLLPNRKDNAYCVSVFLGAIVNVLLNIILIPHYGAKGAAVSTTIAEVFVCIVQSWYAYKYMELTKYAIHSLPFFIIGAIMCFCVHYVTSSNGLINILLKISAGALLYIGVSYYIFVKMRRYFLEVEKNNIE